MKLWLKLSLISIVMTMAATCICSLVLLIRSGESNLGLAVNNALSSLGVRANSWRVTMNSQIDRNFDELSELSLARYLAGTLGDSKTALVAKGELVYNAAGIDPLKYLAVEDYKTQYIIENIDGYSILIAGKYVNINNTPYVMYQMEDVSHVFDDIRSSAYDFAGISLTVVAVVGLATVLLTRFLLRPVSVLKRGAALISNGVYNERVEVSTDDEIGGLARDFNKMTDVIQERIGELKEEIERRTLLLSALTHELKTPLTSISGNAQTLLLTKLDVAARERSLKMIDGECTRLERLSQKLMNLIVLKREERADFKEEDVGAFLSEVARSLKPVLEEDGLKLKLENSMDKLVMDKDMLASLLINLVDNARKASTPGGSIFLIAAGNTIEVRDEGGGIPRDELKNIRQPFYMVDKSRAKKSGGIGLGLALAEEIARIHGASLLIESELCVGTSVKVVFKNESNA